MKLFKLNVVLIFLGISLPVIGSASSTTVYGRQYFGKWEHYEAKKYYYCRYYYKPYPTYTSYEYLLCVYYYERTKFLKNRPFIGRYVYFYDSQCTSEGRSTPQYIGRFDTQGTGDKVFSLLAPKDRKKNLNDIPESDFPNPGPMPPIPGSKDNVRILPIDLKKLPNIKR